MRSVPERGEVWLRVGVLAACVLLHVAGLVWLLRPDPVVRVGSERLEVVFIERAAAPPFPQAPVRQERTPAASVVPRSVPSRSRDVATTPRPTPSAPPDPPADSRPALDSGRLLDLARMAARAEAGVAQGARRDPTRRSPAQLPGRAEPYTPEAIRLHDPVSPQRIVAMVGGMLFGGAYDPCPDTRSKLADLVARNDRSDDEELQRLIDRERRRCR